MKITGKIGEVPFEAMANMGVFAITLKHALQDRYRDRAVREYLKEEMERQLRSDECKRDLRSLLSAIGATIESEEA
jgi:hypothetical protein